MVYFHFCGIPWIGGLCGILGILDLVAATLSWDPRDLGSQVERMSLDPGEPGSRSCKLSWDLAELGFCTAIMPLHLKDPLHSM